MIRYKTENGNKYRVFMRRSFNQIEWFSPTGLQKIGSVPAGNYGDGDFPCRSNHCAHQQIIDKIETHAGSRVKP